MKTMLAISVLSLAVPASPALAQASDSDTGHVQVIGQVAPVCILGDPSRPTVDLGTMAATSGTRVGRIAALPAQDVTLPNSFCNFAGSTLTVTASALVSDNSVSLPSGFARAVNYTAVGSGWDSGSASATSTAAADGSNPAASGTGSIQPLPRIADIQVQLSAFSVPSDALLMADTYSGLVTVTLGPAAVAE